MITKQYFPSLNGNAFVKDNLVTKLKEFEGKTNKESFVVGAYNGTPIIVAIGTLNKPLFDNMFFIKSAGINPWINAPNKTPIPT